MSPFATKPPGEAIEAPRNVAEDEVRLERLTPASPHVLRLTRWEFQQWSYLDPERRLDEALSAFREQCGPGGVPSVFVALCGVTPVGMASLVADDMHDRPDLTPWLASVYVVPAWRGRGIASRLVQRVEEEARVHGIERFHLFTSDRQTLYRRLGWQALEECVYRGEAVTLMVRQLPPAADCAEPA
ncbi:GNAT family N-acetyltransferase [Halomonas sp.]|uniref:GNAT family N-acetyltransferase n=1 Tax=Halomonas sp. TaxID=1486246 RepID=UPI0025C07F12|nr:GNAT family N-acetyltransferase [Halomonas sp.]